MNIELDTMRALAHHIMFPNAAIDCNLSSYENRSLSVFAQWIGTTQGLCHLGSLDKLIPVNVNFYICPKKYGRD